MGFVHTRFRGFYHTSALWMGLMMLVLTCSGCGGDDGPDDTANPSAEVVIPAELTIEPSTERIAELVEIGREAFSAKGCIACHLANGQPLTGPGLANIYGEPIELSDGRVIDRDLPYLYRSIVIPQEYKSQAGKIVMPPYAYLDEQTLVGMVYFIRSLTDVSPAEGQEDVDADE